MDYSLREPVARPYTEFYRLAWRRQVADNGERSLIAAVVPPGSAHVHLVHSLAFATDGETVLSAGFWDSIAMDYLLRVTGRGDLGKIDARMMPVPETAHPLAYGLLLRTLRLNGLTNAYADLWRELYEPAWQMDTWACDWPKLGLLGMVGAEWAWDTPLRTEYARRAALVEIDALVAVWLRWDIDELLAAYESRFNVLAGYEEDMYFDAKGRTIASNWNTFGLGQTKADWKQFEAYLEDPELNLPPDGYVSPFYKADRVAEYRQAHAVFSERLRRAQAEEGDMR